MTTDSDAPIPNNPPAISPADLALIALQLAARSGQPTETCFPEAHRLLSAAARYLGQHKVPENTSEVVRELFVSQKIYSFAEATAPDTPLGKHLKSQRALKQAIERFEKKGYLKSHEAKRMLKGGILGDQEISSERIAQLCDSGSLKPDEAARLLHGGQLTELDISLLLRVLKRERCGELDDGDKSLTDTELSKTIPEESEAPLVILASIETARAF